ncbi:tRNA pseudouridine38-40 synthase [Methanocalculus alkaliphilus]|uniref:tRNA pseudouridine(38-40) synthase TruA n=1 Tax=Methanocalculus alkaliphilus TaxID=768730 RepID=UPI00209D0C1B|nr:tRNA pseudouridine(38-40) synthase TruA [Methanocalculus alkaliphilus]MCP1716161.1 tRNA pseudouridine38-40 synthase [Methanocalculus alkaliphilus]
MGAVETADTESQTVRIAFRIAYAGRRFSGSQQQPDARTVEGVIIDACIRLGLFSDFRSAAFVSAGRTDAGVSAYGQVIAFSTSYPDRAIAILNQLLPPDCWSTGWAYVPPGFNPRYAAESRTYRYLFPLAGLDPEMMEAAARHFIGLHDFSRIARVVDGRDPRRRIITTEIWIEEGLIIFEVVGESFLWNMVRGMATLLLAAGSGLITPDRVAEILREPGDRIPAAPADPLILWDVSCGLAYHPMARSSKAAIWLGEEERSHLVGRKIIDWLGGDRLDLSRNEEFNNRLGHLF